MMRKAAVALLVGAYFLLALSIAALFWRAGAGWAVDLSGFVGALALALAIHAAIGRSLDVASLRRELTSLRDAHHILADNIEAAQEMMQTLSRTVQAESTQRTDAIVSEVRLLENLVERMGENLQNRLATTAPQPAAATGHHAEQHAERQRAALLETVREALAEDRIDLYLQPVVSLPQRRTAFYEGFSRLRDESGRVLMPAEYLAVAEPEGLITAIDNLLLFRCVQIVRRLLQQDRRIGIFCNISPASLGDEQFFPQFIDFMTQNRDLSAAVIFELGQKPFRDRSALAARNMAKLADLGFRFSVDKVSDLELDFNDLARADVRFLKVGARVLLEGLSNAEEATTSDRRRDIHPGDFGALTRRYGVEVIAEKIESEREVIDVLDFDIAYGQGHLFGEPRAIREAVLAEAAPPPEIVRGVLRRSVGR